MNELKRNGDSALLRAAKDGSLPRRLKQYVKSCRPPPEADPKKEPGRLPTFAGFCGRLRCGTSAVEELRRDYPELFDYVCAVLEDEALNSFHAPTLVNAYLKEHFGYGERASPTAEDSAVRLVFEHDILEDGE